MMIDDMKHTGSIRLNEQLIVNNMNIYQLTLQESILDFCSVNEIDLKNIKKYVGNSMYTLLISNLKPHRKNFFKRYNILEKLKYI